MADRVIVRLGPEWRLIGIDELPATMRAAVVAGTVAPAEPVAGVLLHALSGIARKALSREAFGLIGRLGAGAVVPCSREIAVLVLDGPLEVRRGDAWTSGPAALDALCGSVLEPSAPGSLAEISLRAIRTCVQIDNSQSQRTAQWLYRYNRWAAAPRWSRKWATGAAVIAATETAASAATLSKDWRPIRPRASNDRWRIHAHRSAGRIDATRAVHKIYISVEPPQTARALAAALPVLTDLAVPQFKIAADMYGLLRPDKFVCYLTSEGHMREVASALHSALVDLPAQGVPFTAAVGADGLVSWATDPPRRSSATGPYPVSWRGWVTSRLARAAAQAVVLPSPADRYRYVLFRAQLDGVDTTVWIFRTESNAGGAPW